MIASRLFRISSRLVLALLATSGCLSVTSGDIEPPVATTGGVQTGGPQATCTPKVVVFPPTNANHLASGTVVCTNTGSTQGQNLKISLGSPSLSVFSATFMPGTYPAAGLGVNQKATINVSYVPTMVSADQGTLTLNTNAGQVSIALVGDGLSPSCQLAIPTAALDFGKLAVGATSSPISFAIDNVGQTDCQLQAPLAIGEDATGSFHIASTSIQPLGSQYSIPPPGQNVTSRLVIQAQFSPKAKGLLTAWVGDFVSLSGTGQ